MVEEANEVTTFFPKPEDVSEQEITELAQLIKDASDES